MSALTFLQQILGYNDVEATNNPTDRPIDYAVTQANIPVDNPQTEAFNIDPGVSFLVFDGIREFPFDNTTAFDLTLNAANPTIYRLTWSGGTAPQFRTTRGIDVSGSALTFLLLANLSVQVTTAVTNGFSGVLVGDTVFIPGLKTGDPAGVFNDLNCGFWSVLSVPSSTVIILSRAPGIWEGIGETVTPAATSDFQVFSPDGVQVGETVDFSAGFATPVLRSFDITAVTANFIEFLSTAPLGPESGVAPGTSGMVIYTQRKRFVGIRTNQEIVVRYNGDTGNTNRVEPLLAGTPGMEGSETKFGSVWRLEIYNRSTARAVVRVATAE
jgi:hypothetical protein